MRLVAAEATDFFSDYGSELLQRIADTVAIMLYEMELRPDGSFECLTFVGLETLNRSCSGRHVLGRGTWRRRASRGPTDEVKPFYDREHRNSPTSP
jgi:hypothetical protein